MLDIVGIDQPSLDHMVLLGKIPETDSQLNMERQCWQGGGRVATALVAATRLGARTGLMGRIGADRVSHFIAKDLAHDGVDVSQLQMQPGSRSDYVVVLAEQSTHGRSFIGNPGNYAPYAAADLPKSWVRNAASVLLYRFDEADRYAAQLMRESGGVVACDCDPDEHFDDIMASISFIDVFIASEFAYRALFPCGGNAQENCLSIQTKGPCTVIFTLGERGCIGVGKDGVFFELPAFPVRVVDTNGAGDTFHGAYLYASLCEGKSAREAARFASAASAIQCMFLGGRAGLPTRAMVEKFLKGGSIDYTPLQERERLYADFPA